MNAVVLTIYTLYFYVLSEWIFFATKPSFLTSYALEERVFSLLSAPLVFLLFVLIGLAFTIAIFLISPRWFNSRKLHILILVPGAIVTTITVLLLDNFIYSALQTAISHTENNQPYVVLIVVCIIYYCWCKFLSKRLIENNAPKWRGVSLLVCSSALGLVASIVFGSEFNAPKLSQVNAQPLPDIVLFATDGVEADHISTYGYPRQTTPHLEAMAVESMVIHNAIANAGRTTGSTTSMLNGKYPTTSKVIFPPHVASGRHAFQHLPGILKKLGYRNIQESVRYYADSDDLNLIGGFDLVNGRPIAQSNHWLSESLQYKLLPTFVLVKKLWLRVKDRALHIIGYRAMTNAFDAVNPNKIAKVYGTSDQTRIDRVNDLLATSDKPVFAHIHLMETHCCHHAPRTRLYSANHAQQNEQNVDDFYDDTILDSDLYFAQLINQLKKHGKYNNALIIYSSDHTRGWKTDESVPLIIKFPNQEHIGHRFGLNQLVDVAPTILDYLQLPPMPWMEGRSLLRGETNPTENVFTIDSVNRKSIQSDSEQLTELIGGGPPLYGVKSVSLINCTNNFRFDITENKSNQSDFAINNADCRAAINQSAAEVQLKSHLRERGFGLP